mmetsp:Transcript_6482/g.8637  ORF Transcript_6482/g.8637 Transcript_6482/m.8637 type:complete len:293 (-) Transcript_6482:120-998(-)
MTTPLFNLPSSSTSTLLFNSTSSEQGTSSSTTQTNPVMTLSVPTHSSTSRTQLLQQQQQPPPRTTTRTPPPTTAASPQPTISTTFTSLPPSQQQSFVESIFSEVIEEMNEETCLRAHKDLKYGLLCSTCGTDRDILQCRPGFDVFGQSMRQLPPNELLQCPNCQRSVTAARFVPHLEKCMGLGRASSRLATRRIAAIGKDLTSERRIDEGRDRKRKRPSPQESRNGLNGKGERATRRSLRRMREDEFIFDEGEEEEEGEDDPLEEKPFKQEDELFVPTKKYKVRPVRNCTKN